MIMMLVLVVGVALYPQYATSDSFSLGLRAEYFAETEGGASVV